MPNILVVEDEGLLALDLRSIITEVMTAEVVLVASVAAARVALVRPVDFAFLDINVADGTSFDLARELSRDQVRFAFTSGAPRDAVPTDLRWATFLPKPYGRKSIADALGAVFAGAQAVRRS